MIIDLAKPDLRKLEVSTHVKTTTGHVWQLRSRAEAGETWRDETSGLAWLPVEARNINHHDAMKLETKGKRLPTREEFVDAEMHGIREVLADMDHWFWSSSVHPDYSNVAYVFVGRTGVIYYDFRDYAGLDAVRCVARR